MHVRVTSKKENIWKNKNILISETHFLIPHSFLWCSGEVKSWSGVVIWMLLFLRKVCEVVIKMFDTDIKVSLIVKDESPFLLTLYNPEDAEAHIYF